MKKTRFPPTAGAPTVPSRTREGDREQAVMMARSTSNADVMPRLLVDPAPMAADQAAAIDWFSPSPDDRAALCAVPLLDMLRYQRFLLGALWVPEHGDPDDPEQFTALAAYSPYHRVVEATAYPATLILTAESDSSVDPLHARKFAARVQAATATPDELADSWALLARQIELDVPAATETTRRRNPG